jgi:uncharacterized membrane protein
MIQNSILVNRPIDAVFDYAAQFERHPEWQPDLKSSRLDAPAAMGVTGTDTRQMGSRTRTYAWEVTELDRPNRIGFKTLSGPVRPVGSMSFHTEGDATRVDFQMAMNPRGLMKLLSPMISRQVQTANNDHMSKFKELLESGAV